MKKTFLSILLAELWNWVAPYIRTTPTKNTAYPYYCPCLATWLPVHLLITCWSCFWSCLNLCGIHSLELLIKNQLSHQASNQTFWISSSVLLFLGLGSDLKQEMAVTNRAITNRAFLVQLYCCCFCILCPNKDFLLLWSSRFPVPFVFPQMQDETEKPYK